MRSFRIRLMLTLIAGITVVSGGASGSYDTQTQQKPILGFVFAEKGLIGDLSLEGSKISKIKS